MAYTNDVYGLLEEIRDLLNTEDASIASYPRTELGLWQAIRDFLVANGPPGGGGDYSGPLDLVSGAMVAYGLRALSSSARGNPLFTLRRNRDGALQSFSADAITGEISVAAVETFLGSRLCIIAIEIINGGADFSDGPVDLTLTGGTSTAPVVINAQASLGIITQINSITTYGDYSIAPSNPVSCTGGDGNSATFTCTFSTGNAVTVWNDQGVSGEDLMEDDDQLSPLTWSSSFNGGVPALVAPSTALFGLGNYMVSEQGDLSDASGAATFFFVGQGPGRMNISNFPDEDQYALMRFGASAQIDISSADHHEGGGLYEFLIGDEDYVLLDAAVQNGQNDFRVNGTSLPENNENDRNGAVGSLTGMFAQFFAPNVQELIVFPSYLSDPNRLLLRENLVTYYDDITL